MFVYNHWVCIIMIMTKMLPPLRFFRTCQSLVGSDRRFSLQKLCTVGVRRLRQRGRPSGGRVWLPHQDGGGDSTEGELDFRWSLPAPELQPFGALALPTPVWVLLQEMYEKAIGFLSAKGFHAIAVISSNHVLVLNSAEFWHTESLITCSGCHQRHKIWWLLMWQLYLYCNTFNST